MYNIYREIEGKITDSINNLLDEYVEGRTTGTKHARNVLTKDDYDKYFNEKGKTIQDAKKEFRKEKNITQLIKDIKWVGFQTFCKLNNKDDKQNEEDYRDYVKSILKDVLKDRIALEKDSQVNEKLKKWEEFNS